MKLTFLMRLKVRTTIWREDREDEMSVKGCGWNSVFDVLWNASDVFMQIRISVDSRRELLDIKSRRPGDQLMDVEPRSPSA
jgi:hypothetical protein